VTLCCAVSDQGSLAEDCDEDSSDAHFRAAEVPRSSKTRIAAGGCRPGNRIRSRAITGCQTLQFLEQTQVLLALCD